MSITANRELSRYVDQELRSFLVAASAHVYKGTLVGFERATGFVRHFVAGDVFAGIAYEEVDNSAGSSGGELSIRLYTQGDFSLPITGGAQNLAGGPVYAVDNENLAAAPVAGSSVCGILIAMTGAAQAIVRILPMNAPQTELVVSVPLASSTSVATTNPVFITQRAIKVVSAQVAFNTVPNSGALDVGTDNTNPNQVISAFNLATLTAHVPANVGLFGRDVPKNQRIWAKVGQASSTAGIGGQLTLRYIELP